MSLAERRTWSATATGVTVEGEQAIRRDERARLAQLLTGDLKRLTHLLARRLATPALDRGEAQKLANLLTAEQRRILLKLLDGDLRRFAQLLTALFEQPDKEVPRGPTT